MRFWGLWSCACVRKAVSACVRHGASSRRDRIDVVSSRFVRTEVVEEGVSAGWGRSVNSLVFGRWPQLWQRSSFVSRLTTKQWNASSFLIIVTNVVNSRINRSVNMVEIAHVKKWDKPNFETTRISNIPHRAFSVYSIVGCLNSNIFPWFRGTRSCVLPYPESAEVSPQSHVMAVTLPSTLWYQLWFYPLDF